MFQFYPFSLFIIRSCYRNFQVKDSLESNKTFKTDSNPFKILHASVMNSEWIDRTVSSADSEFYLMWNVFNARFSRQISFVLMKNDVERERIETENHFSCFKSSRIRYRIDSQWCFFVIRLQKKMWWTVKYCLDFISISISLDGFDSWSTKKGTWFDGSSNHRTLLENVSQIS